MAKNIEELFDGMDEAQTDALLRGIDEPADAGAQARIRALVDRKTGVCALPAKRKTRKTARTVLLAAAAVAVFAAVAVLPFALRKSSDEWGRVEKDGMSFRLNADGQSYELYNVAPGEDDTVRVPETVNGMPVTSVADKAFLKSNASSVYFSANIDRFTADALMNDQKDVELVVSSMNSAYCNSGTNVIDRKNSSIVYGVDGVIPEGITMIGVGAFEGRTQLQSVTIPEGVTQILDRAFLGCTALESVTIPSSMRFISPAAFGGCTALRTVVYGGSRAEWEKLMKASTEKNGEGSLFDGVEILFDAEEQGGSK